MATGVSFKCEKCGKKFSVFYGGLTKDLSLIERNEKKALRQIADRDSGNLGRFVIEVQGHEKECDGVIKYSNFVMAD